MSLHFFTNRNMKKLYKKIIIDFSTELKDVISVGNFLSVDLAKRSTDFLIKNRLSLFLSIVFYKFENEFRRI